GRLRSGAGAAAGHRRGRGGRRVGRRVRRPGSGQAVAQDDQLLLVGQTGARLDRVVVGGREQVHGQEGRFALVHCRGQVRQRQQVEVHRRRQSQDGPEQGPRGASDYAAVSSEKDEGGRIKDEAAAERSRFILRL